MKRTVIRVVAGLGLLPGGLYASETALAETPAMTRGEHCLNRANRANPYFNDAVKATLPNPSSFVAGTTTIASVGKTGRHLAKLTYRSAAGQGVAFGAIDHVTCRATLIRSRADGMRLIGN